MQKQVFFLTVLLALAPPGSTWPADSATDGVSEVTQQVIGGVDAAIENYPWMGALVFDHPSDFTGQFCGGTAIDRYWVLTAAHCVDESRDLLDFQIVFNTADLKDNSSAYVAYPSLLVLHSDYINLFNRENDIALIQLREPLPDSIPLIPLGESTALETPGLSARIVGWGRTTSDPVNPEDADVLQEAEVSLISHEFANLEDYFDGLVSDSMIAAGVLDPYTATFRGDSGGPLIAFNDQTTRWEQIGISSWGAGCSKPDNPISIFTRISSQLDWIEAVVERDFHQWSLSDGNAPEEDDGDPYSLLMEFIFNMDPTMDDAPTWMTDSVFETNGPNQAIFTPVTYRSSVPKFGLSYEFSADLKSWEDLPLDWSSINTRPGAAYNTTEYLLPTATSQDDPGFFRLRHEGYDGVLRGPTTLGIGTMTHGLFNADTLLSGPERYDYILDHLGSDLPIELQIESDRSAMIRLQLIELETDTVVYDQTRTATEDEPLYVSLTIGEGRTLAARVESTQTEFQQAYEMHTAFFRDVSAMSPGTRIQSEITAGDSAYRRQNHFSTAHAYSLSAGTTYLIEMESADLDAVFFLRDRINTKGIHEVDYQIPGVTEQHLFSPDESLDLEIIASSWFPEDTGRYELEVRPYSEPSSVRPEDEILGILDTSDETDEQNGILFYINRFILENLSPQNEYTVYVNGRDNFIPQFAVLNITDKKTEYFEPARCDLRTFRFQPAPNTDYGLLIVSSDRDLGENFEIHLTTETGNNPQSQGDSHFTDKDRPTNQDSKKGALYSRASLQNYLKGWDL